MYETIKKFLDEGGRCLLIENGKPIGVVLTMEEYDRLKSEIRNPKSETIIKPEIKSDASSVGNAIVGEMNFPETSAELADIASTDDIILEDLGIDELPY